MKTHRVLLIMIILGLALSLSASVRINGLGSYFEYLIPDTETDIELFPSHLGMIDSKYVQINHNGYSMNYDYFSSRNINFSLMPLSSRLSYRINLDIASNDYKPRVYLNDNYNRYYSDFVGFEYGAALVKNTLSYKFSDSFHFGCFVRYGVNWKEINDEHFDMEDPDIIINQRMEDIEYDDDYIAAGINFRFISDYIMDISLFYSKNEIEDISTSKEDYELLYSGSDHSQRRIEQRSESIEIESEDIGFAVLLETTRDNAKNRYFLESHYTQQPTEYLYDAFAHRLYFENEELTDEDIYCLSNFKTEYMDVYSISMGFGKALTKEKLDIYYGVKLYGMYGKTDRSEDYTNFEYYQHIYPDTTYTDSIEVSGESVYEIKDWKAVIEVPFGVSYSLSNSVKFNGGLGMKLIRQELEYFEDNEFSRWETDRYVAFGTTISPFECIMCDINFGNDFTGFSKWQLDLKYLW